MGLEDEEFLATILSYAQGSEWHLNSVIARLR